MLKRLGIGLIKGLLIGGAAGAGLQYGLPGVPVVTLLGYLLAMGVAGTAGVFAGKAPWKEGAWIEALLKGLAGVGLGALAYFGLNQITGSFPFPGVAGSHTFAQLPVLFAPAIAGAYGALVELDNTGDDSKPAGQKKSAKKARVAVEDDDAVDEPAAKGRKRKRRRRA